MKKTIISIIAVLFGVLTLASTANANTQGGINILQGGTGWTSSTPGDLIIGTSSWNGSSGALRYSILPIGSSGQVLQVNNGTPSWVATSSLGITSGGTTALTNTSQFWVDSARTDSYTANGTIQSPYKTISALITGINNSGAAAATVYIAASTTYVENSDTWPNIPITVYGDSATIITGFGGGTGLETFPNIVTWNGGVIAGSVALTNTSTTTASSFENNGAILGNFTCYGLCTMSNSVPQPFISGATSTVFVQKGALLNIAGANIGACIQDNGGGIIFSDDQLECPTSGYAVMASSSGSYMQAGFLQVVNPVGNGIYINNGAKLTEPDFLSSVGVTTGVGGIPIYAGTTSAYIGPYEAYDVTTNPVYASSTNYRPQNFFGINSQGYVSIGTTSTSSSLTVANGSIDVANTGNAGVAIQNENTGAQSVALAAGTSNSILLISNTGGFQIQSQPASVIYPNPIGNGSTGIFYANPNGGASLGSYAASNLSIPQGLLVPGYIGIGTSTPGYSLVIAASTTNSLLTPILTVASSTNNLESIMGSGALGFNGNYGGVGYVLQSNGTSSLPNWVATSSLGVGGGGAVSSVSNSDGTLTISPTTSSVVASLNLAHANTWTATTTFTAPIQGTGSTTFFALGTTTQLGVANIVGTTTLNGNSGASGLSIPNLKNTVLAADLSGNIIATTSTISGVAIGNNLFILNHDNTLNGTAYNGSAAVSNLGINLTNPNTWTGGQIFGNSTTTNATTTGSFAYSGSGTSTFGGGIIANCFATSTGQPCITGGSGGGGSTNPGGSSSQFQYNNGGVFGGAANLIYATSTGYIGIGTSSPVSQLAIAASTTLASTTNAFTIASSSQQIYAIDAAGDVTQGFLSGIGAFTFNSTGYLGIGSTSPSAPLSIFVNSGFSGSLPILSIASSTSSNTATSTLLTLLGNGNFGVATSTPDRTFDVNGAVRLESGSSTVITPSISGVLTVVGCDTATTSVNSNISSSTSSFITTPQNFPGVNLVWQSYLSGPGVITTELCSTAASITPTASQYVVKIIQ